ncbi:MAG TPA: hypothetical protein VE863_06905 [Pyrinomonadaceae bacterium]|jgi:hypothetical protein|nr:hypothetical protein [Pyrinomonadaceae bacterium]
MKVKRLLAAPFLIAAVSLILSAQTERALRRIVFARGATEARATAYLRGIRDNAWFVLRLGAGQHVRVQIDAPGSTRGVLIWPSGKQDGGPGGVIYDGGVDETGDYKISVGESLMGEAWRGRFSVIVEALPRGQSSFDPSDYEKYVGKYPNELFKSVPAVKTGLRQLLAINYQAFTDRMQVETPIEKDGDTIVMRGCMAHLCTIDEAILVIDLNDGAQYVALKFAGKFRPIFAVDKSRVPESMRRAMRATP